jgi:predicted acetylornithine/succinylornithine family transaminase
MVSNSKLVELTGKYIISNYGRLPLAMVRGRLEKLWDADGKEYLDFFAGFGAGGVSGHCHPAVVAAVAQQAQTLLCHGNLFTNEPQVELARGLAEKGFGGLSFFCHSGAEAVEAALKLARLYAGAGRYKIVSFHHCFHGRTMGALSLTPEKYQKGFEPMLPGNVKVELNDIAGVDAAVDDLTAGIIVEPIQGEGGVNLPTVPFMQHLRRLCDQRKMALICDEVWCAPARTGKWFAYQHYGIEPDIMSVAKALGGGLPVGAMVAKPALAEKLVPGTHGCTMGGNPLCAAAGVAVMKLIEQENLLETANRKGEFIISALKAARIGRIQDIRGKGLMLGIALDGPGKEIVTACLQRGLLINCTQDSVLRLAPPLVIADSQLQRGVEILIDVFRS